MSINDVRNHDVLVKMFGFWARSRGGENIPPDVSIPKS